MLSNKMKLASVFALCGVIIAQGIPYYGFKKKMTPVTRYERQRSITEIAIADMCKDDYIAEVIVKSKYPLELAAIAKQESDCRPQVIGDSGDSKGMYQIQAKHWGSFDCSIEGQTNKAEFIIDSLVKQYGYERAIRRYNGSGNASKKYARSVLSKIKTLDNIVKSEYNAVKGGV